MWVYYIPKPPLGCLYDDISKIIRNIDLYRSQQQGYGHPLTIIMYKEMRKETKPHGETPPSRKDMKGKPKIMNCC